MLKPIETLFKNNDKILNFLQFKSLIENFHDISNPLDTALTYTADIDALISLMKEDLYPHLKDRITRKIYQKFKTTK